MKSILNKYKIHIEIIFILLVIICAFMYFNIENTTIRQLHYELSLSMFLNIFK